MASRRCLRGTSCRGWRPRCCPTARWAAVVWLAGNCLTCCYASWIFKSPVSRTHVPHNPWRNNYVLHCLSLRAGLGQASNACEGGAHLVKQPRSCAPEASAVSIITGVFQCRCGRCLPSRWWACRWRPSRTPPTCSAWRRRRARCWRQPRRQVRTSSAKHVVSF